MPKQYNYREVTRTFENKLSIDFGTGGERNGWYLHGGKKIVRITLPHIHRGDIPKGTLNNIKNQTRLSSREFEELVDCTMSDADYETALRSKGLL